MKKLLAIFALLALLASMETASAFSTEKSDNRNPDGTEKFSDPDEQMPAFVGGPEGQPAPMTNQNDVTLQTYGDVNEGAQTFNRATAHMENAH